MPSSPVSPRTIADYLGIDLSRAPTEGPRETSGGACGWRCANESPFVQRLRSLFPITAGHVSLELASDLVWCLEPSRHVGYTPTIELQLVVSPWKSVAQKNFVPDLPVPSEGGVLLGKRTPSSATAFLSWYERRLQKHVREAAKRMQAVERLTPHQARTLMPHDLWTQG